MDVPRTTPREVFERLNRGEHIVFIDARSAVAWEVAGRKLPGAIRVPPDDIDAHVGDVPRGATIVTYCT